MKTVTKNTIILACLFASSTTALAVVDQTLEIQRTNLVLTWPSLGYEYYVVQYRPNLDPGTQWQQLTNCYHANSTNRTTFIIPCCALNALDGGASSQSYSQ